MVKRQEAKEGGRQREAAHKQLSKEGSLQEKIIFTININKLE